MAKRKAFITGITGQDGSYLAEILLEKDYEVYGMIRRSSSFNTARIDHIFGDVELVYGDLGDGSVLNRLMRTSLKRIVAGPGWRTRLIWGETDDGGANR